jgi:hypothetical protein
LDARAANERIAEKAEQLHFLSRVPMMCECSARDCRVVVMIALDEYHAIRRDPKNLLTAPGHDADQADRLKQTSTYDIHHARPSRGNGDRRSA